MKRVEVEVFSDVSNRWIVRSPGRRSPGLLIQGDSLNSLRQNARAIVQRATAVKDQELLDEAQALLENLDERLRHYETVLREHGIDLPYPS